MDEIKNRQISSFTIGVTQYEVRAEGTEPALYKDGRRVGAMWWLSISSGLGRFRAAAKKGFDKAEAEAYEKRQTAETRRNAEIVAQPKPYRRGWTGHVALCERIKDVLNVKRGS